MHSPLTLGFWHMMNSKWIFNIVSIQWTFLSLQHFTFSVFLDLNRYENLLNTNAVQQKNNIVLYVFFYCVIGAQHPPTLQITNLCRVIWLAACMVLSIRVWFWHAPDSNLKSWGGIRAQLPLWSTWCTKCILFLYSYVYLKNIVQQINMLTNKNKHVKMLQINGWEKKVSHKTTLGTTINCLIFFPNLVVEII